jgi:hypothetical protein
MSHDGLSGARVTRAHGRAARRVRARATSAHLGRAHRDGVHGGAAPEATPPGRQHRQRVAAGGGAGASGGLDAQRHEEERVAVPAQVCAEVDRQLRRLLRRRGQPGARYQPAGAAQPGQRAQGRARERLEGDGEAGTGGASSARSAWPSMVGAAKGGSGERAEILGRDAPLASASGGTSVIECPP